MTTRRIASAWAPRLLSLTRIVLAFTFTAHGSQKLFGFPAAEGKAAVEIFSFMGFAGALEFVGGLLLLVGLFTRPVAFLLSGTMAVAYFMAHASGSFWPIVNRGELAVVYCWIFLYFAAAGGGPWSLDALLRRDSPLSDADLLRSGATAGETRH
jgi:putative oxidoreductase